MSPDNAARWDIPEKLLADADASLQRIIAPTIEGLAKDFRSCWAAYDAFVCETFDLDPLLVLRAFCPPIAEQVTVALAVYAKIEPDADVVKECIEVMTQAWARCEGRG